MKTYLSMCLVLLLVILSAGSGGIVNTDINSNPEIWERIENMSLEEKLGQIFVIRAHSNLGQDHINEVKEQIQKYHVGGLCFFQGDPTTQAQLTNEYQALSKTPLLVSIDAEWNLSMRFKKDVIQYPRALMYGAIRDNNLIYDFGRQIAKDLKRIGVHMNFGPVADINNNPNNPVINDRSFGEDRDEVTAKSYMYVKGMQENGVMAVAKHFPGHGDTDVDSHHELPLINHSRQHLEENELFPFRSLINADVAGIMVAHLNVPAIDSSSKLPMTLSNRAIEGILRRDYGYDGLVITDAMEMKGVTKYFDPGEASYRAFEAGNDIILLPDNMSIVYQYFMNKLKSRELSIDRLEKSVYRILLAKEKYGALDQKPIDISGLEKDLNSNPGLKLKEKLIRHSVTLVRDEEKLIPVKKMSHAQVISIGADSETFRQRMQALGVTNTRHLSTGELSAVTKKILKSLNDDDLVVLSIHNESRYASKDFGINNEITQFVNALDKAANVVTVVFGNPYSLRFFDHQESLICAYENDPLIQSTVADALAGRQKFRGYLPVTASPKSQLGDGLYTANAMILEDGELGDVGLDEEMIKSIDRYVDTVIRNRAAPGCQVLVAKDGKIVMEKCYGYYTYDSLMPMHPNCVFDLASITKVASTTLAIMKLVDDGFVDLDTPLHQYIPEFDSTNKSALTLRKMMSHHARLRPWIPFYQGTLAGEKQQFPSANYYRNEMHPLFQTKVTDQLYLIDSYQDSILTKIAESELRDKEEYKYSDLGLILAGKVVESVTGLTLDRFVSQQFYEPMMLMRTGYCPIDRVDLVDIPPTEIDDYYRLDTIQGYVHDMTSAMMGGVAGHAGLFSNARDLAAIFQMLLNGGTYGDRSYLSAEVIDQFLTRYKKGQRRGIGFDMKDLEAVDEESCNISYRTSARTFGHYGFTGTAAWADPEHNLIYIFLSNRTFPTMENRLLYEENYRSKIQSAIYDAFEPN